MKKRKFDILLIFVVLFSVLFLLLMLSNYQMDKNNNNDIKKLGNTNSINIVINKVDKINQKNLKQTIDNQDKVIIKANYTSDGFKNYGYAIYYNYELKELPNIIYGSFIPKGFSSQLQIVVGKNVVKDCIKKENKLYYTLIDKTYEVIGVMGYNNKSSIYDYMYYTTYNFEIMNGVNELSVYSDSNKIIKANSIVDSLNNISSGSSMINKKQGNYVYISTFSYLEAILIIIIVAISIIIISYYWIKNKMQIIAISKMYGGTNEKIIFYKCLNYFMCIFLGSIIGASIYYFLSKTGIMYKYFNIEIEISIITVLISLIIISIISLITILFVVYKKIKDIVPVNIFNNNIYNNNSKFNKIIFFSLVFFEIVLCLSYISYTIIGYNILNNNYNFENEMYRIDTLYKINPKNITELKELNILEKQEFLDKLQNAKSFKYITQNETGILLNKKINKEELYYTETSDNIYETVIKNENLINYNALSINFEATQDIKLKSGKNFDREDFVKNTNITSIIMGSEFSKYFKLNEEIKMYDIVKRDFVTLKIIGFLEKNTNAVEMSLGNSVVNIDNYILIPFLNTSLNATNLREKEEAINYINNSLGYSSAISLENNYTIDEVKEELNSISNQYIKSGYNIKKTTNLIEDSSIYTKKLVNSLFAKALLLSVFSTITILIWIILVFESNMKKYSIKILCGCNKIKLLIIEDIKLICIFVFASIISTFVSYYIQGLEGVARITKIMIECLIFNLCISGIVVILISFLLIFKFKRKELIKFTKRRD